mmetsp:Transcript_1676/g.2183  ORF Transcript_1676/g.2183 Transcript_1676/m.2183 type:complete len:83 (-) Transcript_1676:134-382(-)|eukprot:CAMPEP_0175097434 /NCGR_PEP_ID=MMETSP0086_2-20121207/5285_1 /TAXON_ID=136419 /ORGANISM="Unknown Unknown, Strain D1" /LENGTH=82 /DNA_ID=CAMNT_0016370945 /DNA_START=31 /DNA_END=279 /DNA_ORIENTATION=-
MTRGNQREIDRARSQARAAKHAKPGSGADNKKAALSDAEKMREKQRLSELKKQGIEVKKDDVPRGPKGKPIPQNKQNNGKKK